MLLHISSITKSKFSQRKKNWENNSVRASIFSCPPPLCCSVNGQWDNSACGALFTEDRYALTHQQLQELLKMSAYAHMHIQSRPWKPFGEKGLSPAAITCIHTCCKSGVGGGGEICTGWLILTDLQVTALLLEWRKYDHAPGRSLLTRAVMFNSQL